MNPMSEDEAVEIIFTALQKEPILVWSREVPMRLPGGETVSVQKQYDFKDIARVAYRALQARQPEGDLPVLASDYQQTIDAQFADIKKAKEALDMAHAELNAICARDGVPYTHYGVKSDVSAEYFSQVVDECSEALASLSKYTSVGRDK